MDLQTNSQVRNLCYIHKQHC